MKKSENRIDIEELRMAKSYAMQLREYMPDASELQMYAAMIGAHYRSDVAGLALSETRS